MPLIIDREIGDHTRLAVWNAQEGNAYFKRSMKMTSSEKSAYLLMKSHRQREWMTSRFLLHYISDDKNRTPILKTEYGKPYRKNNDRHISISHSKDKVAVIISDKTAGIDIQNEVGKITRIQHKFISDAERARLDEENLIPYYHVFWGAKESMYKAYGTKELDFKDHMHLYPFRFFKDQIEIKGWVKKEKIFQSYDVYAEKIDQDYLVFCLSA